VFIAESIPRYGAINRSHPLARGLVAAWYVLPGMASGNRWYDLAGNNHGTLTNGPEWRGGALNLDGTDDYVEVAAHSSLALGSTGSPMTASVWVNRRSSGPEEGPLWAFGRFYIRLNTNGGGDAGLWGKGAAITGLLLNVWQHICFTFDGNASLRAYVNGVANGTNLSDSSIASGSPSVLIGSRPAVSYFDGHLNDVRIYNRALSPGEVRGIYTNPLAIFNRIETPRVRIAAAPPAGNRRRRLIMGAAT
jgi:hypothetical protein